MRAARLARLARGAGRQRRGPSRPGRTGGGRSRRGSAGTCRRSACCSGVLPSPGRSNGPRLNAFASAGVERRQRVPERRRVQRPTAAAASGSFFSLLHRRWRTSRAAAGRGRPSASSPNQRGSAFSSAASIIGSRRATSSDVRQLLRHVQGVEAPPAVPAARPRRAARPSSRPSACRPTRSAASRTAPARRPAGRRPSSSRAEGQPGQRRVVVLDARGSPPASTSPSRPAARGCAGSGTAAANS